MTDYPTDVCDRLDSDAAAIIARYPNARSALLPLLHLVQSHDGWVTSTGIAFCARHLGLTDAQVTAVSTFYSMYRRGPTGDYLVGVCTNTLCAVMGGDAILAALTDHLDIEVGQTTADGTITLEHVECNAACDYAPVVMVNWEFFDNQTPDSARTLTDSLRVGRPLTPARGAQPCTFAATARILAGFADDRPDAVFAAHPGEPTLRGLRVAAERGMSAPPDTASATVPGPDDESAVAEAAADKPAPAPTESVPLDGRRNTP